MDNNTPIDPKSQEAIAERIKIDKARVIAEAKTTLSITSSALKAGVSRATIYRWEKEDAEFKKKLQEALLLKLESVRDGAFIKLYNYVGGEENNNDWRAQLSLIRYTETRIFQLTKEVSPSDKDEELEAQTIEALGELLIAASKKVKEADK